MGLLQHDTVGSPSVRHAKRWDGNNRSAGDKRPPYTRECHAGNWERAWMDGYP